MVLEYHVQADNDGHIISQNALKGLERHRARRNGKGPALKGLEPPQRNAPPKVGRNCLVAHRDYGLLFRPKRS